MDSFTGTPGAPRGEKKQNRLDRERETNPRHPGPEFDPNAKLGESAASRSDRLRQTDVTGLKLRAWIERKQDRY
jgi:hypothetical protein